MRWSGRGRWRRLTWRKKKKALLMSRCHWLIDFNRCLQLWSSPNRWLHHRAPHNLFQHVPSCGLNRELIYTHTINNIIQSIIRSVELKTPIVSPMSCVHPPSDSHRNMLHFAASSLMGRSFMFFHSPCSQLAPLWPVLHTQLPATHSPCPPHWGSIHCEAGTSHSVPFQPL